MNVVVVILIILTDMKLKRFKTVRMYLSKFIKDLIKFLYEKQKR